MFQRLSAQSVSACYRGVAEPALRDEFFGASISEIYGDRTKMGINIVLLGKKRAVLVEYNYPDYDLPCR